MRGSGCRMPVTWTPEGEDWRRRKVEAKPPAPAKPATQETKSPEIYRGWSVSERPELPEWMRWTAKKDTKEISSDTLENLKQAVDDLEEQEAEVARLGYRPSEIPITLKPVELEKRIRDVDKGEIRLEFQDGVLAVIRFRPPEGYVMHFRTEPWRTLHETTTTDVGELKRVHGGLKWGHPGWQIVRKWDAEKKANVFIGRPAPIRHVARTDPYLLAREVLARNPKRIEFHPIPSERIRVIRPEVYPRIMPAI